MQIGESFECLRQVSQAAQHRHFRRRGSGPAGGGPEKGRGYPCGLGPGRLNDLIGQGFIDLSALEIFVLDEADRMLDMGFVHDVKKVIAKAARGASEPDVQRATMPKEIEQLAAGILHDPAFVKVDPVSSTVERIDQSLYFVEKRATRSSCCPGSSKI